MVKEIKFFMEDIKDKSQIHYYENQIKDLEELIKIRKLRIKQRKIDGDVI